MPDYDFQETYAQIIRRTRSRVEERAQSRAWQMLDALEKTANRLLTGARSGRRYYIRKPGYVGWHTASAPGELPAEMTSRFRFDWDKRVVVHQTPRDYEARFYLQSKRRYSHYLEAMRPWKKAIVDAARPRMLEIARQKYL